MANNEDERAFLADLMRSYDVHLVRRQDFEHRAQQLLSFVAVIGALLGSFLIVVIVNKPKLVFLLQHPLFSYAEALYYSILACYLASVILSFAIVLVPKWISPAIRTQDLENLKHGKLNLTDHNIRTAYALLAGIEKFRKQNACKYVLLRAALAMVVAAVVLTASLYLILFRIVLLL